MGMMLSALLGFVFVLCFDDNVFDTNGVGEIGPRWKRLRYQWGERNWTAMEAVNGVLCCPSLFCFSLFK